MTKREDQLEEHLTAEEDDGSAEIQPEDGGSAESPPDKPSAPDMP
ncbi:hypothetical protein BH11ACT6_BH11ACT6_29280 [soil metagenome]